MENSTDEEKQEQHILITRASVFLRPIEEKNYSAAPKSCWRNINYIKCKNHCMDGVDTWTKQNSECEHCMLFPLSSQLPTAWEVLSYYLTKKSEVGTTGGMYKDVPLYQTAMEIMMHWVFCNVYTITACTAKKHLKQLFDNYRSLKNYPKKKRGDTFQSKFHDFHVTCEHLFDIRADEVRSKKQEILWGVVMAKVDNGFYDLQKLCPQQGYCSTFVERKWKISQENERLREEKMKERLNKSREEIDAMKGVQCEDDGMCSDGEYDRDDDEYVEEAPTDGGRDDKGPARKKKKGSYKPCVEVDNDPLPKQYRYLRICERVVRPEVYMVLTELKSKYHMSESQAEGAMVQ